MDGERRRERTVDLLNNVSVLGLQLADVAKVADGLVATSAADQPAGGLLDEEGNSDGEKSSGDELSSEGDDPLETGRNGVRTQEGHRGRGRRVRTCFFEGPMWRTTP